MFPQCSDVKTSSIWSTSVENYLETFQWRPFSWLERFFSWNMTFLSNIQYHTVKTPSAPFWNLDAKAWGEFCAQSADNRLELKIEISWICCNASAGWFYSFNLACGGFVSHMFFFSHLFKKVMQSLSTLVIIRSTRISWIPNKLKYFLLKDSRY